MDTKDYNEKLLEYIYGNMSKEEESRFKEELKQNPEEAKGVELRKRIVDRAKGEKQLEEILNDPGFEQAEIEAVKAIKEYDKRKRREYLLSRKFRQAYIYPFAAGLLFLVLLGNILTFSISPETAFQKYYKDYTPEYYAQATLNEAQILLVHSIDEYNKGNYDAVAENMRTLMEKSELNIRGQVMLAFYDAWKDPPLHKFKTEKTTKEDAIWYLALTSLKLENFKQAQALFHEIATQNYRGAGKAARLERKISKMRLGE